MTFKRFFSILPSISGILLLFVLLLCLGINTVFLVKHQVQLNKYQHIRYQSYLLANELRQSSEDLTRFARAFVATGDPTYEQKYKEVLDIRNGKKPRHDGRQVPLHSLMQDLKLTKDEFANLKLAEDNSNALANIETMAMNAIKGRFDDGSGLFNIIGQPDLQKARHLLHDDNYLKAKTSILEPIDIFIAMLDKRTYTQVGEAVRLSWIGICGIAVLVSVGFIIGFIQIRHLYTKVLKPLGGDPGYAALITRKIASGDLSTDIECEIDPTSLLTNLKTMQISLKSMISQMTLSASQVADAAAALSAARLPNAHNSFGWRVCAIKPHETLVGAGAAKNGRATEMAASVEVFKRMAESIQALLVSIDESEVDLRLLAAIVAQSSEAILSRDLNGKIMSWNAGAAKLFGYGAEEAVGATLQELNLTAILPFDTYPASEGQTTIAEEIKVVTKHGETHDVQIAIGPLADDHGLKMGEIIIAHDVTERKQTQARLFTEQERALITLEAIGDGVITTDTEGLVEYINPVAERLSGHTLEKARGRPIRSILRLINETTFEVAEDLITQVLREKSDAGVRSDCILANSEEERFAIEDRASLIRNYEQEIIGAVLIFRDVSQARRMAQDLSWQASHDSLTGLYNRREFEQRLGQLVAEAKSSEKTHCLLYLDIDQFKLINDTCGHVAGDKLLNQVVPFLQTGIRIRDTLARLGGDEFGLLLEECTLERAQEIAEGILNALCGFRFIWQDKSFAVGMSIGVVGIAEGGDTTATAALAAADAACYSAKDKGRNRVQVYRQDDRELAERHGEMQWVSRINRAFEENRFRLYYQTIAPLKEGMDHGEHFEVLLRMLDEQGKIVPPMAFIPAAERYGLMPAIDRKVISLIFEWCERRLQDKSARPLEMMSINLSGASIGDEQFLQFLQISFATSPIPPSVICFEITETAAIANFNQAMKLIKELKELGCRFSLDDFGSGLSSFAYLKNLPVDYLKIDGGFVKDMQKDTVDHAMVRAINSIGHEMGIRTIAEFVENDGIKDMLREIGVDYAQGYGIAKPQPLEDQQTLTDANAGNPSAFKRAAG